MLCLCMLLGKLGYQKNNVDTILKQTETKIFSFYEPPVNEILCMFKIYLRWGFLKDKSKPVCEAFLEILFPH